MRRLVALTFMLLAACQDAPSAYTPAILSYGSAAPIRLNVAEIRVVDYAPANTAGHVERDFPTAPNEALRGWIKQRLIATGNSGVLEVTIDDASVKEVKLPITKGFSGMFKDEQDARYDLSVKATFRLYDGIDPMSRASGDVIITRSHSINEKATLNDRDALFDKMTQDMLTSFDTLAQARFQQYFSAYLR